MGFKHYFPYEYYQSQSAYPNQQLGQNPFFLLLRASDKRYYQFEMERYVC